MRYVYDESVREPDSAQTEALTPEVLAALTAHCLMSLHQATIDADLDLMVALIA